MKDWEKFNESSDEEHRVNDGYFYNIFRVYDYKGGELNADVNLSRLDVCHTLIESFFGYGVKLKIDQHEDDVKQQMSKIVSKKHDIYAGGDGWCGEIYVVKNNKLSSIPISSFFDDIIDILRWDSL